MLYLFILSVVSLAFPEYAFAYIDPGTGSFFFQALIAVILGGLFTVKLFWQRIKSFVSQLLSRNEPTKEE